MAVSQWCLSFISPKLNSETIWSLEIAAFLGRSKVDVNSCNGFCLHLDLQFSWQRSKYKKFSSGLCKLKRKLCRKVKNSVKKYIGLLFSCDGSDKRPQQSIIFTREAYTRCIGVSTIWMTVWFQITHCACV